MTWCTGRHELLPEILKKRRGAFRNGHFAFVSSGQVSLHKGELGFQKGLLVRDLDGHVMQLVEQ